MQLAWLFGMQGFAVIGDQFDLLPLEELAGQPPSISAWGGARRPPVEALTLILAESGRTRNIAWSGLALARAWH